MCSNTSDCIPLKNWKGKNERMRSGSTEVEIRGTALLPLKRESSSLIAKGDGGGFGVGVTVSPGEPSSDGPGR